MSIAENIKVQVLESPGAVQAVLRNISRSGGLIEVFEGDYVPQRGDLLEIKTYTRDYYAEVVWVKEGNLGVCFFTPGEIQDRMMRKTSFAA